MVLPEVLITTGCAREFHWNRLRARFSGLDYDNPPEKLEAIKEKYRNGVSVADIAEMVGKLIL